MTEEVTVENTEAQAEEAIPHYIFLFPDVALKELAELLENAPFKQSARLIGLLNSQLQEQDKLLETIKGNN